MLLVSAEDFFQISFFINIVLVSDGNEWSIGRVNGKIKVATEVGVSS